MAIDIRANVICSLGPIIQGAISDDSLGAGQGLVTCSGQVVIEGLITPKAGTKVEIAYVRNGIITRIPRVMRVISSFADPFRNLTTVQLGDKLVWLNEKSPNREAQSLSPNFPASPEVGETYSDELPYPVAESGDPNTQATIDYVFNGICWQKQNLDETNSFRLDSRKVSAAEQSPTRSLDEELRRPITISASTIARKCLAGLGLSSLGITLLRSSYEKEEAQISSSYVSTLENLLANEGLFGFLDANEVLIVRRADQNSPGPGIFLDENNIIDISPIGQGSLAPELSEDTVQIDNQSSPPQDTSSAEPTPPQASDFRLPAVSAGSSFTVSYSRFLQNATYDFYRSALGQVKVNVSAGQNCSVTTNNFGVTVSVEESASGNGTLEYTVSDGTNQSDSATAVFGIAALPPEGEEPPEKDPVLDTVSEAEQNFVEKAAANLPDLVSENSAVLLASEESGQESSGQDVSQAIELESSSSTYKQDIIIEYNPFGQEGGERAVQRFSNSSSAYRKERTGYFGEALSQEEITWESGAAAAGGVFQVWLEAGKSPGNASAVKVTETQNFYNYSYPDYELLGQPFAVAVPQSSSSSTDSTQAQPENIFSLTTNSAQAKTCGVGGQCERGIDVPENPEDGQTFQYGECNYIFNGSTQRWEATAPEGGGGEQQVQTPPIPTLSEFEEIVRSFADEPPRIAVGGVVKRVPQGDVEVTQRSSVTRVYESGYYVAGGIQFPKSNITDTQTGATAAFPPPLISSPFLTEETWTYYDTTYFNGLKINRTKTVQYRARYKTSEGQHYLSERALSYEKWLNTVGPIPADEGRQDDLDFMTAALGLVVDSVTVDIQEQRNDASASSNSGDGSTLDFSGVSNLTPSNRPETVFNSNVTFEDLPEEKQNQIETDFADGKYDPSLSLEEVKEQEASFAGVESLTDKFREENAATFEQYRYEVSRFVSFGNRYGLSLQVAPWNLPSYPLSPIYINMRSVIGRFSANGISITFNPDGIIANCDALLSGGVGGTGVQWFPLPEGAVLPDAPEPTINEEAFPANSIYVPEGFDVNNPGEIFDSIPATDEDNFVVTLEPDAIVPSIQVNYKILLGIKLGIVASNIPWSLTPQIKDQALGVVTSMAFGRQTQVSPPAGVVAITGIAPIASGGASVAPATLTVALAAEVPTVSGGASVAVPAADIAVAPAPGPVVPRESTVVSSPVVDVAVAAAVPGVSGGASVPVPVADVTVAAAVPTVSMVAPPLMKVLLYTGNGSTNTQTGVGFEPGLVWTKRRTSSVADHAIYDYVQGTTKYWRSNQAAAQVTDANSLTAFGSDGFTLGSAAISNTNSASYVAWCLTKGGTGSSNTDGSITTTVYANSTAGYNIFTYTGTGANATIGHGLGASPELIFIRNLGVAQSTAVGGDFLASNEYIFLGTSGKASSGTVFQSYSSTTISVGSNSSVNGNSNSMLGYAFKSVAGNTDIGTYTGTGTTNQSITCGFAPQFVLIKAYSTTGSWMIFDNTRGVTLQLAMGENTVEGTVDKVTLDSNGFTVKANQNANTNAVSYVYLAIR